MLREQLIAVLLVALATVGGVAGGVSALVPIEPAAAPAVSAQIICIHDDPRPGLWTRATFAPTLRPGIREALHAEGLAPGEDLGILRLRTPDGCWEVMSRLGQWENYDPARHLALANKYSLIGEGWSGGHTSDDGFSFAAQHEEVTGQPLEWEGREFVEYEYSRAKRLSIQSQWCQLQPEPRPLACGSEPGPIVPNPPPPPVVLPPANPNSACDGLCQAIDRTCSANGTLTGGRCPSDCAPCPADSTDPTNAALVRCGFDLATCGASLHTRDETDIPALKARIIALEIRPTLSRDLESILRGEWTRVANSGAGLRARYSRTVRVVCATYVCPLDLPGVGRP